MLFLLLLLLSLSSNVSMDVVGTQKSIKKLVPPSNQQDRFEADHDNVVSVVGPSEMEYADKNRRSVKPPIVMRHNGRHTAKVAPVRGCG